MEYQNNLLTIRKSKHLSQEELAKSVDSCRNTIGNIEKGLQDPSLSMAYRIAKYLELSVYDIFPVDKG